MLKQTLNMTQRILTCAVFTAGVLFSQSGTAKATPTSELHLVMSSCRSQDPSLPGYFQQKLYGNGVDLTHRHTFDGKAITIDIEPNQTPGLPHIQEDFLKFSPTRYLRQQIEKGTEAPTGFMAATKQPVKQIFFERPPVCMGAEDPFTNLLGRWLNHIAPFMPKDATLSIEWEPYLTVVGGTLKDIETCIQANPFNAWLHVAAMHCVPKITSAAQIKTFVPPAESAQYKPEIERLYPIMIALLSFYHSQGVGESLDALQKHVHLETSILGEWMTSEKQDQLLLLPGRTDACQTVQELSDMLNKRLFEKMSADKVGKRFKVTPKNGQSTEFIAYDQARFLETSFTHFLWHDVGVVVNAPVVKSYIESIGFKDVSIERKTNPHNRRKNVWMIEARKV